jgi:hypothetical protein
MWDSTNVNVGLAGRERGTRRTLRRTFLSVFVATLDNGGPEAAVDLDSPVDDAVGTAERAIGHLVQFA